MMEFEHFHPDLLIAQKMFYGPQGLGIENFITESESKDYAASEFELGNRRIKFRVAKITPTKNGQLVTLWKRFGKGSIMPFDSMDRIDFFIISVRRGEHLGQFIFPTKVLLQQGYVSKNGVGGKRAMRVYPPWDKTGNSQAHKTQAWQLNYFVEVSMIFEREKIFKLLDIVDSVIKN